MSADGLRVNESLIVKADLETANGVIHVIDTVLLPEPMNPAQAMQMLDEAIQRGVPVFNRGYHHECAEIYKAVCMAIVSSKSDQLPQSVMTALKSGLERAEHQHDAGSRAWALRGGMDSAMIGLREMSRTTSRTAEVGGRILFSFDNSELPPMANDERRCNGWSIGWPVQDQRRQEHGVLRYTVLGEQWRFCLGPWEAATSGLRKVTRL